MIYEKNDTHIYFSHVPRTGGRYVERIVKTNSFSIKNRPNEWFIDGKEHMHLTYDHAKRIRPDILNMKKLVIVRNPVTRFESACNSDFSMRLYFRGYENFLKMKDPLYFNHIMTRQRFTFTAKSNVFDIKGIQNAASNWFVPQKEFFDETFYVWKYENGLGKYFKEFLRDKVGIDVDPNKYVNPINSVNYDKKLENFKMSDAIAENVLNFYKDDYEYWKNLK